MIVCSKLDVSGNEGITEHGIYLLSVVKASPDPAGDDIAAGAMLCQSLTFLSLFNTAVNPGGLALALAKLPMLTHLEHEQINKGILKFIELNEGQEIKLETLCVTYEIKHQFELFANIMKCIKKLKIECGRVSLASLRDWNGITDLTIICSNDILPSVHVIPLITKNINLTRLNIQQIRAEIDISMIGNLCRNLEEFTWKNNTPPTLNSEYSLNENHFTKLVNLKLVFPHCFNRFPNSVLANMLSSPCLEQVTICNLYLEEQVLDYLITKARNQRLVFGNLKSINFVGSTFYHENLRDIICMSPNLREVHVTHPAGHSNRVYDEVQALAQLYDFIFEVNGYPRY